MKLSSSGFNQPGEEEGSGSFFDSFVLCKLFCVMFWAVPPLFETYPVLSWPLLCVFCVGGCFCLCMGLEGEDRDTLEVH